MAGEYSENLKFSKSCFTKIMIILLVYTRLHLLWNTSWKHASVSEVVDVDDRQPQKKCPAAGSQLVGSPANSTVQTHQDHCWDLPSDAAMQWEKQLQPWLKESPPAWPDFAWNLAVCDAACPNLPTSLSPLGNLSRL